MIKICEVGPRDGLQTLKEQLSTEKKVELITRLIDSGVKLIEAVSFVNPKVIPQMADAVEVMKRIPRNDDVQFGGLVLSKSGLERAIESNIDILHVVVAASDTFNQKNVRRNVDDSLAELIPVVKEGVQANRKVNAVLGTAFGCPYEGTVSEKKIVSIAEKFINAGASEITLADTTGLANPAQVKSLIELLYKELGEEVEFGLHFHNTRGLGIVNAYAGYQAGVRRFDSSIGGLGGCPFAPKAAGNVCTEDLINMFEQMGEETGISNNKLIETSRWLEKSVGLHLEGMLIRT
ncbi:hydroxymethylglutaryl-CoA lyase [Evansella vedderi]|uniref:Hydroxymethylglutaryl-CoA lyase n=1 Tax=Evansella vedderi TaxID=38282 RepID=A0ABT9ZYI1_9BACI|nr:hydroxymethylglutaryl-CoA lyase [Evansella vedderi]MDQ0256305.1 hydroxymethylglutaryl-CoA lyase [Evansella vedderi]